MNYVPSFWFSLYCKPKCDCFHSYQSPFCTLTSKSLCALWTITLSLFLSCDQLWPKFTSLVFEEVIPEISPCGLFCLWVWGLWIKLADCCKIENPLCEFQCRRLWPLNMFLKESHLLMLWKYEVVFLLYLCLLLQNEDSLILDCSKNARRSYTLEFYISKVS